MLQYVVKFPAANDTPPPLPRKKETVALVHLSWINNNLNTCKWSPKKYHFDKIR